jgi:hypothetical protein
MPLQKSLLPWRRNLQTKRHMLIASDKTGDPQLDDALQISRECALLGNYDTSLIYYQGAMQHAQG